MAKLPKKKNLGRTLLGVMFSFLMLSSTVLAICDLSFALFQYLSFVNVLEKGVNFASNIHQLKNPEMIEVSFVDDKEQALKEYIGVLLGAKGFNLKAIGIVTKTLRPGIISVKIEKRYYSLFGFFNNIPIEVQGMAVIPHSAKKTYQKVSI